jgi:hypothetical protein
VQCISSEHPPLPLQPIKQDRRHGEFCCCLVGATVNRLLGQDHASLVTKGNQGMDRRARWLVLQAATLGFAVDGDAFGSRCRGVASLKYC